MRDAPGGGPVGIRGFECAVDDRNTLGMLDERKEDDDGRRRTKNGGGSDKRKQQPLWHGMTQMVEEGAMGRNRQVALANLSRNRPDKKVCSLSWNMGNQSSALETEHAFFFGSREQQKLRTWKSEVEQDDVRQAGGRVR